MNPAGYRYGLDRRNGLASGTRGIMFEKPARGIIIRLHHHPFLQYTLQAPILYHI